MLIRNARCEGTVKQMRNWQNYLDRFPRLRMAGPANTAAHKRHGIRGDEGASLVEMALACAVLFAVLFGLFEMTLAFYTYHFVSEAAREATRWAIVRGSQCSTNTPALNDCNASTSDIQNYVQNLGYPGLSAANLTVTTAWLQQTAPPNATWAACAGECNSPGNQVQVTVAYAFPLTIPYWKSTTLNVSSTSTMVISQ